MAQSVGYRNEGGVGDGRVDPCRLDVELCLLVNLAEDDEDEQQRREGVEQENGPGLHLESGEEAARSCRR